jgi:aconitate hydratase
MMAKNVVEKILSAHLVEGEMVPGNEIAIRIDQTLTQDATGTMAYLQFETMDIPRVRTELSVSYVDHNTLQVGFENADDHRYLQSVASKYGILFSRPGNGICHQVHLERFGRPGRTLIGSDSHTPTGGGIGMIAIGAGGLDVAVAMAGGPFHLSSPEVIRINLNGALRPMVSAKDVILKVLSILTTKGNVGKVVEYGGTGLAALSVPERAVITNMGAELGVTTSVFPSDQVTRDFLRRQGREGDWTEILPDADAGYGRTIDIDLGSLNPMIACPHSPDNVKEVGEIEGLKVDQVAIGSCTNSSLKDLLTVAEILKGKSSFPSTDLIVAPGSRQVFRMADKLGAVDAIVAAGGRMMELACGFCIGNGQSPPSAGVSLRTNNRNFKARSGTDDAQVYLVSPETAAVSALTGRLTDPTKAGLPAPHPSIPDLFLADDSMVLLPAKDPASVTIIRGPNIGAPPYSKAPQDSCRIRIAIKTADKTTTDDIMPAGQRLKYRSNIPKYSEFVFEKLKPSFAETCRTAAKNGEEACIVGRESYGQGSSREHAAICPMYLGVRFVLAQSIERIHRTNLINFGIIPLRFLDPKDYDALQDGDLLSVSGLLSALGSADKIRLVRDSDRHPIECGLDLSIRDRRMLAAGGLLNMMKTIG